MVPNTASVTWRVIGVLPGIGKSLRVAHQEVRHAGDDDDDQGEDLGGREDVLHLGHGLHVVAVHRSEQAWNNSARMVRMAPGGPALQSAVRERHIGTHK